MTIPVGRAQSKHKLNYLRARPTGFYHRAGAAESPSLGSLASPCSSLIALPTRDAPLAEDVAAPYFDHRGPQLPRPLPLLRSTITSLEPRRLCPGRPRTSTSKPTSANPPRATGMGLFLMASESSEALPRAAVVACCFRLPGSSFCWIESMVSPISARVCSTSARVAATSSPWRARSFVSSLAALLAFASSKEGLAELSMLNVRAMPVSAHHPHSLS